MADQRIYLRHRASKDSVFLGKRFGFESFTVLHGMTAEQKVDEIQRFFDSLPGGDDAFYIELEHDSPAAGWRSMETAPKDKCILVRGAGAPTVVGWHEYSEMWSNGYGVHYKTDQLDGWFPIPEGT